VNDSEGCHALNYDPLNRPVEWENTGATDNPFVRSWYRYDNVGREVATWRDDQASKGERYSYDVTGRLTNVRYNADQVWLENGSDWDRTVDYAYAADKLNRTSMNDNGNTSSYTYSQMNQYVVNGAAYNYDGNFDLASAANSSGASGAFIYDGLGRCVKRTINGVTVVITYDGWKPTIEWDANGNLSALNLYGTGPDEILYRYVAAGNQRFRYHHDIHGNVIFLLDFWSSTVVERYTYDAFGKPTSITDWWGNGHYDANGHFASSYDNRFMFQGREWLGELGIYDYRHRIYQPDLGRFLQTDPLGLQTEGEKLSAGQKALYGAGAPEAFGSSEMNLFRYCGDDPVDMIDPTGLRFSDSDFEPQDSIPGKFGNTEFRASVGVAVVPDAGGRFALQIYQFDVVVRTKQFATQANGHPRSAKAIQATKEHENLHVAHAREIHDDNQNRIIKTGLTKSEAEQTRKTEQDKVAGEFYSAAKRDQQDCKRGEGDWKSIVDREKKR
jgi:RHS repeat-associated protein